MTSRTTKPPGTPVSTREGYGHWAATYDIHDNPMTAMVDHVLAADPGLARGRRILELGCGTGRNAATLLAQAAHSYVGLDSSPEMLAIARRAFASEPRVRLEQRDLDHAWWRGLGRFDLVLVSLVLEHLPRIDPPIAGAARVVDAGGLLWILELHPDLHASGVGAHIEVDGETLLLPSYRHDKDELTAILTQHGWDAIATIDHCATPTSVTRSSKLSRYLNSPVLLEVRGRRNAL